jgi:hypothetical protein
MLIDLKIDRQFLATTLAELIRINSINPTLTPGGAGEAGIAACVATLSHKLNLEVAVQELLLFCS